MHCNNAPCLHAAKNGAVYRRADGIVIIDPQKARGRNDIVKACPYGAIWWNEKLGLPQKCTMCAHLLDSGWTAPRCVQACPTGALSVDCLDSDRLEARIVEQGLQPYNQGIQQPVVYYKNLYRFFSCFVSGRVATKTGSTAECAAGAVVRLFKDERFVDQTTTDDFGEFKFDGLDENSGPYVVEIQWQEKTQRQIVEDLSQSRVIDTVWL
jgi:Fe-S-cluster-containing dehydrogenase component